MRKKCIRNGHRWSTYPPLPVQFCNRCFCGASRPAPWLSPQVQAVFRRVINEDSTSRGVGRP